MASPGIIIIIIISCSSSSSSYEYKFDDEDSISIFRNKRMLAIAWILLLVPQVSAITLHIVIVYSQASVP